MFDLTGRKALVTGATGGIGEEIAKALHKAGATVGLHGTRAEKLDALAAELGERVHVFPANLADRDAVKALGAKAEAELEGVNILVNNAGITKDGLFVRMSDADWDAVLEVDLTSVFRLTRELTHPMMRRRFGRIINITSIVGVTGNPGQANYCAAKAGMIGLSKSLAQEGSPRRARLVVHHRRRLVAAAVVGRSTAPHEIDVFAQAHCLVEAAELAHHMRAPHHRRGRHIADPRARGDTRGFRP